MTPIVLPAGHESSVLVVSMSGGKDSTATALRVIESGLSARFVFADTGWEAPETYEYLGALERILSITIDRVGAPGGMRARWDGGARMPSRVAKWCTDELKLVPLKAYHNRLRAEYDTDDTINVIGVRAEESEARAKMPAWEFSDEWGGYVWRPILLWTIADVLAIHHRHGVPVNPLYLRGHNRVGCYPCIREQKEGIALIAEHAPWRIDEIADAEAAGSDLRAQRNRETPGRYKDERATFFQATELTNDGAVTASGHAKRKGVPFPVRDAVAWSRTARGGVQLRLIAPEPEGGCFRWGLCEPPVKDGAA